MPLWCIYVRLISGLLAAVVAHPNSRRRSEKPTRSPPLASYVVGVAMPGHWYCCHSSLQACVQVAAEDEQCNGHMTICQIIPSSSVYPSFIETNNTRNKKRKASRPMYRQYKDCCCTLVETERLHLGGNRFDLARSFFRFAHSLVFHRISTFEYVSNHLHTSTVYISLIFFE